MRTRSIHGSVSLAVAGFAAITQVSCAGSGDPSAPGSTGDSEAVSTLAVQLTMYGCGSCPYPESLAPIDVALGAGTVLLLDNFEPFLRTFDLDGSLLRQAAAKGEGPGELALPAGLYVGEDGLIVLHDIPPALVGVDGESGAGLFRTAIEFRVPESAGFDAATGSLYLVTSMPFLPGDEGAPRLDRVAMATGQGTAVLAVDEMPTIPHDPDAARGNFTCFPIAAMANGDVIVGSPWDYDLLQYAPDGNLVRTFGREVARPARPSPIEGALVSLEILDGNATEIPHFDRRALDRDTVRDELWVRTYRGDLATETIFDRFDAAGEYAGEVVVPMPMDRDHEGAFDVEDGLLAAVHPTQEGEVLVLWRLVDI